MIRKALRLLIIVVLGILVYNLFLGNEAEKENSREVFSKIKEAGVAVKDLLKSEKKKFDEGKYDDAFEKVGNVFDNLKRRAQDIDEKYVDRIAELEEKRQELEDRLADLSEKEEEIPDSYGDDNTKLVKQERKIEKERQKITRELDKLVDDTEKVMKEMEAEEN